MFVCMHYLCVKESVCVRVCVYMCVCSCVYACKCTRVYACVFMCAHVYNAHVRVHVCVRKCCVCMQNGCCVR